MSKVEEFRFCTYINTFLALIEALINQNAAGVSFDELNDGVETTFDLLNPYLEKILNTLAGKRWLEEEAPSLFIHEFLTEDENSINFQHQECIQTHQQRGIPSIS